MFAIYCYCSAIYMYVLQSTNEILRLFISLTCLQHAGLELREEVKLVSLVTVLV